MKATNTFAILLLIVAPLSSWAQTTVEDDFEGNGTITTWFGDDCGMDTNFDNPFVEGINTSATVLRYDDTGGQYANIRFDAPGNFDLSENRTFTLKIYIPTSGLTGSQTNQISLKLQNGDLGSPWTTQSEVIKSVTTDEWQTVSFDFANDTYINFDAGSAPPVDRTDFNRIVLQLNGEDNNDHVVGYLDDFLYDGTVEEDDGGGSGGNGGGGNPNDPVYDKLVWADEFDTDGAIDDSKWFHQTKIPAGGSWYNNEIQHYTSQLSNSTVADGILSVKAIRETFNDQGVIKNFTSARLNSKYTFTYGRLEVRAKLPRGVGTWPAIWLLGKDITEDGAYWQIEGFGTTPWPNCGEIDVMEHWGDNQNFVQSATHTASSFGATVNHGGRNLSTASDEFHVYALDWYEERLVFSVDDQVHYTYQPSVRNPDTWPFDDEFYILLNVAILPNIATSIDEASMDIDYVRIYQENEDGGGGGGVLTSIDDVEKVSSIYPNPTSRFIEIKSELGIPVLSELFDLSGQRIISAKDSVRLDLQHMESGIYMLKVEYSNGATDVQKVIVDR